MKENFEILKGSLAITIKSLNVVANNTGGEASLLTASCADTLQANIKYIDALELTAQIYKTERDRLITYLNNKGLLNDFYKK